VGELDETNVKRARGCSATSKDSYYKWVGETKRRRGSGGSDSNPLGVWGGVTLQGKGGRA